MKSTTKTTSSECAISAMPDLSLVIVAKDEERTIGQVLSSARALCREMILVDSGSSDRTVEIAQGMGATCHHQEWLGYAAQKNYALSLAQSTWILSLDADEVLTPELAAEIATTLTRSDLDLYNGFCIPRLLLIGETAIAHGGFYPDAQLRLFRRGEGAFNDRKVHEAVKIQGATHGRVGSLKNAMWHYAYPDFSAYEQALDKYAHLSAEEFALKGYSWWKTSRLNEWLHPWWTFIYRFFFRAGFLDGGVGLRANWIYKDYVCKKIVYLRQLTKRKK
jgi:glycosyltransferase involved in cell wall biosynthesis